MSYNDDVIDLVDDDDLDDNGEVPAPIPVGLIQNAFGQPVAPPQPWAASHVYVQRGAKVVRGPPPPHQYPPHNHPPPPHYGRPQRGGMQPPASRPFRPVMRGGGVGGGVRAVGGHMQRPQRILVRNPHPGAVRYVNVAGVPSHQPARPVRVAAPSNHPRHMIPLRKHVQLHPEQHFPPQMQDQYASNPLIRPTSRASSGQHPPAQRPQQYQQPPVASPPSVRNRVVAAKSTGRPQTPYQRRMQEKQQQQQPEPARRREPRAFRAPAPDPVFNYLDESNEYGDEEEEPLPLRPEDFEGADIEPNYSVPVRSQPPRRPSGAHPPPQQQLSPPSPPQQHPRVQQQQKKTRGRPRKVHVDMAFSDAEDDQAVDENDGGDVDSEPEQRETRGKRPTRSSGEAAAAPASGVAKKRPSKTAAKSDVDLVALSESSDENDAIAKHKKKKTEIEDAGTSATNKEVLSLINQVYNQQQLHNTTMKKLIMDMKDSGVNLPPSISSVMGERNDASTQQMASLLQMANMGVGGGIGGGMGGLLSKPLAGATPDMQNLLLTLLLQQLQPSASLPTNAAAPTATASNSRSYTVTSPTEDRSSTNSRTVGNFTPVSKPPKSKCGPASSKRKQQQQNASKGSPTSPVIITSPETSPKVSAASASLSSPLNTAGAKLQLVMPDGTILFVEPQGPMMATIHDRTMKANNASTEAASPESKKGGKSREKSGKTTSRRSMENEKNPYPDSSPSKKPSKESPRKIRVVYSDSDDNNDDVMDLGTDEDDKSKESLKKTPTSDKKLKRHKLPKMKECFIPLTRVKVPKVRKSVIFGRRVGQKSGSQKSMAKRVTHSDTDDAETDSGREELASESDDEEGNRAPKLKKKPCPNCGSEISDRNISRHLKVCKGSKKDEEQLKQSSKSQAKSSDSSKEPKEGTARKSTSSSRPSPSLASPALSKLAAIYTSSESEEDDGPMERKSRTADTASKKGPGEKSKSESRERSSHSEDENVSLDSSSPGKSPDAKTSNSTRERLRDKRDKLRQKREYNKERQKQKREMYKKNKQDEESAPISIPTSPAKHVMTWKEKMTARKMAKSKPRPPPPSAPQPPPQPPPQKQPQSPGKSKRAQFMEEFGEMDAAVKNEKKTSKSKKKAPGRSVIPSIAKSIAKPNASRTNDGTSEKRSERRVTKKPEIATDKDDDEIVVTEEIILEEEEDDNQRKNALSSRSRADETTILPIYKYYYSYTTFAPKRDKNADMMLRYKCQDKNCQHNTFYDNITLMRHFLSHVNLDGTGVDEDLWADVTRCNQCFSPFNGRWLMQSHYDKEHAPHTTKWKGPHKCKICERDYDGDVKMVQHMRSYHVGNEMPYVCPVCSFKTSIYNMMIDHFVQRHNDVNWALCPFCFEGFQMNPTGHEGPSWGSTVKYFSHLTLHKARKRHKCQQCRLSFVLGNSLSEHMDKDHRSYLLLGLDVHHPEATSTGDLITITVSEFAVALLKNDAPSASSSSSSLASSSSSSKDAATERSLRIAASVVINLKERAGEQMRSEFSGPGGVVHNLQCIECHRPLNFAGHFRSTQNKCFIGCDRCAYVTSCSFSYSKHVVYFHGTSNDRAKMYPKERALAFGNDVGVAPSPGSERAAASAGSEGAAALKAVECVSCGFISRFGRSMTDHLIEEGHSGCRVTTKSEEEAVITPTKSINAVEKVGSSGEKDRKSRVCLKSAVILKSEEEQIAEDVMEAVLGKVDPVGSVVKRLLDDVEKDLKTGEEEDDDDDSDDTDSEEEEGQDKEQRGGSVSPDLICLSSDDDDDGNSEEENASIVEGDADSYGQVEEEEEADLMQCEPDLGQSASTPDVVFDVLEDLLDRVDPIPVIIEELISEVVRRCSPE